MFKHSEEHLRTQIENSIIGFGLILSLLSNIKYIFHGFFKYVRKM